MHLYLVYKCILSMMESSVGKPVWKLRNHLDLYRINVGGWRSGPRTHLKYGSLDCNRWMAWRWQNHNR